VPFYLSTRYPDSVCPKYPLTPRSLLSLLLEPYALTRITTGKSVPE